MSQITVNEIRYSLRQYNKLGQKINELKHDLANVSREYYASQSIVGVTSYDDTGLMQHHSISPEYGALEIISIENSIKKRITALEKCQAKFMSIAPIKIMPNNTPLSYQEWLAFNHVADEDEKLMLPIQENEEYHVLEDLLAELYG